MLKGMIVAFHFLLFAVVVAFAQEKRPVDAPDAARFEYSLVLSTGARGFDSADFVTGGSGLGGEVIIFLNRNPVTVFAAAGRIQPITGFLRRGRNELALEGKHSGTLYVRVVRQELNADDDDEDETEVVLRWKVDPATTSRRTEAKVFSAEEIPVLPLFKSTARSKLDTAEKARIRSGLSENVQEIRSAVASAKSEKLLKLLLPEQGSFISVYSKSRVEEVRRSQQKAMAALFSRGPRISESRPKFVIGDRLIMAYTGLADDPYRTPYLFMLDVGGRKIPFPALFFAEIDGEWIVWK